MQSAIVMLPDTVPAIIAEKSEAALDAAIRALPDCRDVAPGVEHLKAWLATLPATSGWFDNVEAAQACFGRTLKAENGSDRAGAPEITTRSGATVN